MKHLLTTIVGLFITTSLFAQVGIGTVAPEADLEIVARTGLTGTEYNGVTIPKVTSLPAVVPPSGTILYYESGTSTEGFYFSDGIAFRNVTDILTDSGFGTFYQAGSTNIAENTTGPIERAGRISIGTSTNAAMLTLDNTGSNGYNRRGIQIFGDYTGPDNYFGVQVNHNGASTADSYGLYSDIGPASVGNKTGVYSEITPSNPAAVTNGVYVLTRNGAPGGSTVYGVRSDVGNVNGASTSYGFHTVLSDNTAVGQTNYGLYANVGGATARGTKYGVYSIAANTGTEDAYSGWFQGPAFAIRNSDSTDGYTLPVDSGTAGQVLTTDGAGTASWSTPNSISNVYDYATTGASTGTYVIPANLRTLRVFNSIATVTVPDPSANTGRIITIIGRNGIAAKTLTVDVAGGIYDDVTNTTITTISSNQRFTIQSDGTDWIVIGR